MRSLGEAFRETASRRGSATALLYDDVAYSFADLQARADVIARGLVQRGVGPGDRVAVGLPNSPDLVLAILGVIQAGAVLVPLNPAYTADELLYIVGDAGARVAIVTAEHATVCMQAQLSEL